VLRARSIATGLSGQHIALIVPRRFRAPGGARNSSRRWNGRSGVEGQFDL
jgi:peptidoglycan/xylan/chitin deacetylase (PgdA/CDA1 family)